MSLAYLVDTDWVIDHFHGVAGVSRKLEELRRQAWPSASSRWPSCLRHGLAVCSNNRRDFEMVEGLEIVSVA